MRFSCDRFRLSENRSKYEINPYSLHVTKTEGMLRHDMPLLVCMQHVRSISGCMAGRRRGRKKSKGARKFPL